MPATAMNHFTILTNQLETTVEFYRDLLGLEVGPRPPLGFPGAWMYCGGQAVLHIIAGRPMPANPAGVLDHMAFSGADLPDVLRRLDARGLERVLRRQPDSGVWQLFFHDPNGARVELDFAPEEQER